MKLIFGSLFLVDEKALQDTLVKEINKYLYYSNNVSLQI